jgi:tetratricopeptide (TPR) repeat protein
MNNLALVLYRLNRLKEAEELLREALLFNKANLLPNHPFIGISMSNLASVLQSLNRLKEAEELSREALIFNKQYI